MRPTRASGALALGACLLAVASCASTGEAQPRSGSPEPVASSAPPGAAEPLRSTEVFPGVRVNRAEGVVEFDGHISPLLHSEREPVFYIEQIVTTPDTKPHESFVVAEARAEHIHAALLLVGLEPGRPGEWATRGDEVVRIPPEGDPVGVEIVFQMDGGERAVEPHEWIINLETGERHPPLDWVFAGSALKTIGDREYYLASNEGNGTIVGFTTFETETIAPVKIISHLAGVDEPVWIADVDRVPPNETPVVVRITALGE